jgi:hypothetical protein
MVQFSVTDLNNLSSEFSTVSTLTQNGLVLGVYNTMATGVPTGNGIGAGYIAGTGYAVSVTVGNRLTYSSFGAPTGPVVFVPDNISWTGATNVNFYPLN